MNRVRDGVVIGISAASLGMAIYNVIHYKPSEFKPTEIKSDESNPIDLVNSEEYDSPGKFLYGDDYNSYIDDSFAFSEDNG
jgi:hypothetical protein